VIKETLSYLRGRSRASIVGELLAGVRAGGGAATEIPVYESETEALRSELGGAASGAGGDRPNGPRVVVLMCHEEREEVFGLLAKLGAKPIDVATDLASLVPRLQGRHRD
jgi:hypothetical protein